MTRLERVRVVVALFSTLMIGVAVWETAIAATALGAVLVLLLASVLLRWVIGGPS